MTCSLCGTVFPARKGNKSQKNAHKYGHSRCPNKHTHPALKAERKRIVRLQKDSIMFEIYNETVSPDAIINRVMRERDKLFRKRWGRRRSRCDRKFKRGSLFLFS